MVYCLWKTGARLVESAECRVESTEVRGKSFCSLSLATQTALGVIHRVSL